MNFYCNKSKNNKLFFCALVLFASELVLANEPIKLADEVITATRIESSLNPQLSQITVIKKEDIQKYPAKNIPELLATLPGIEFASSGTQSGVNNLYIRGSSEKHVLLLIDGVRIGSLTLGSPLWSELSLSQIEKIEIVRGPASSLYGSDAIGGVVQIFTKNPKKSGHNQFIQIGVGSFNAQNIDIGGDGLQKFEDGQAIKYSLSLGYKKSDEFNATADNPKITNNNQDKDGYKENYGLYRFVYLPSEKNQLGIFGTFNNSKSKYDLSPSLYKPLNNDWQKDISRKAKNNTNAIFWDNQFNDFWKYNLQYALVEYTEDELYDGKKKSYIKTKQNQFQWQNDFKLPLGTLIAVIEQLDDKVEKNDNNYSNTSRKNTSILFGWNADYKSHRWQMSFRNDDNSQFGNFQTAHLGYGYQINTNWRTYVSTATGFKAPTFNDLYWPNLGNPNLKPEKSQNYEAAVHYQDNKYNLSATLYNNNVENLIDWATYGSGIWRPSNIGKVKIKGVSLECGFNSGVGGYYINTNLNFQNVEDLEINKQITGRAKIFGGVSFGQKNDLFSWNSQIIYRGARFIDKKNTKKYPEYFLVNLSANYYFQKNGQIIFNLENALDKKYELNENFATAGRRLYIGVRYEN